MYGRFFLLSSPINHLTSPQIYLGSLWYLSNGSEYFFHQMHTLTYITDISPKKYHPVFVNKLQTDWRTFFETILLHSPRSHSAPFSALSKSSLESLWKHNTPTGVVSPSNQVGKVCVCLLCAWVCVCVIASVTWKHRMKIALHAWCLATQRESAAGIWWRRNPWNLSFLLACLLWISGHKIDHNSLT